MKNWKIEMILKSGKKLIGYYKGIEDNSTDVANKLFVGKFNDIIGLFNKDETKNVLVLRGEIAAMVISIG